MIEKGEAGRRVQRDIRSISKTTFTVNSSSRTLRLFYRTLGFCFVGLGILGIFLPLLPTTPFLLLAAGCFSRSSERCYRWLYTSRVFGPLIRDWEKNRSVSLLTKSIAVGSIILFGGYSTFVVLKDPYMQIFGILVMVTGLVVVLSLKTAERR